MQLDLEVTGPTEEIIVANLSLTANLRDELDVFAFWDKLRYVYFSIVVLFGAVQFFLFRFRRTPISWLEWGVQGAVRREGFRFGVRLYPSPQAEELGYPEGVVLDGQDVADLIDDIRARGLVIWAP